MSYYFFYPLPRVTTVKLRNLCHSYESGNPDFSSIIDPRIRGNDVNLMALLPRLIGWVHRIFIGLCFLGGLLGCVPRQELAALSLPESPAARMQAVPVGKAVVNSIEVQLLESFPLHATVIARGYLPNDCTELKPISPHFDVNTFKINIFMGRIASNTCRSGVRPFESVIPLNIKGLKAGVYTVNVNGIIGNFRLATDNGVR